MAVANEWPVVSLEPAYWCDLVQRFRFKPSALFARPQSNFHCVVSASQNDPCGPQTKEKFRAALHENDPSFRFSHLTQ